MSKLFKFFWPKADGREPIAPVTMAKREKSPILGIAESMSNVDAPAGGRVRRRDRALRDA
jgi:hypothetical protein